MRYNSRAITMVLFWGMLLVGTPVFFTNPAFARGNVPPRKIVIFREGFDKLPAQAALVQRAGAVPVLPLRLVNGMAVLLPRQAEDALRTRPEILRIETDVRVHALPKPPGVGKDKKTPEQPPQELTWNVDRIDAEYAWDMSTGAGVKIAVIDTGIDRDHPDLAVNIAGGVNFVGKNPWKPADPTKWDDDNGHGTHVAGIIAAANNTIGVVGVAPESSLYAVKVLDRHGSGYVSNVVAGIEWAINNGMDIINMSLGTDADILALHDACDSAYAAGLHLVAAAGNDGSAVDYPGAYDSVIAVAATDISDARASFSSFGPEVAIAAPGVSINSTWKGGGYAVISGTSMAAPHVSGTFALNLLADPCGTADDLPPSGIDVYTGCGLVDAGEAVTGIPDYGNDLP